MGFEVATRKAAKLKLGLAGLSGSGKTYTAQWLARELAGHGKVGCIDSERGSSQLYARAPGDAPSTREELARGAGRFDFMVSTFEGRATIQEYRAKIQEAAAEGIDVLIVDSYSHSWIAALEAVDAGGGWTRAGKDISPLVQELLSDILRYPGHVICTFRLKAAYDYVKDERTGKIRPEKAGLQPIARDQIEYEFSLWMTLDQQNNVTVEKTRCQALPQNSVWRGDQVPGMAKTLREWLESGAAPSLSAVLLDKVRFAGTTAALQAVIPELGAAKDRLTGDEKDALKRAYAAKKAELEQAGQES